MTELRTKSAEVSITDILAERGKTHGSYADVACSAQKIKEAFRGSRNWQSLNPAHKEALEMMAMKIARVLNGNPHEPDHWNDLSGYATLGAQSVEPKSPEWLAGWRQDQVAAE